MGLPRVAQDFEAFFTQSLKRIGAGARLVGSSSKQICPSLADLFGDMIHPFGRLDRTWAGDHPEFPIPDFHISNFYNAGFGMSVKTGQFIGGHHRDNLFDAGDGQQGFGTQLILVADDPDNGSVGPATEVGLKTELFHLFEHVADLLFGDIRFQDKNHNKTLLGGFSSDFVGSQAQ